MKIGKVLDLCDVPGIKVDVMRVSPVRYEVPVYSGGRSGYS